jgi:uncharacterized protein involved in copper resistance
MRKRREIIAIAAAAVILAIVLVLFLSAGSGPVDPAKRELHQNAGSDAPNETLPPADAGTGGDRPVQP